MIKRRIGWLFGMTAIIVDIMLIIAGFNVAWWLRYVQGVGGTVGTPNFVPLEHYVGMRNGLVLVTMLVFMAAGIYRIPRGRSFFVEASQLVNAILAGLGLLVIALFIVRIPFSSRLLLGLSGVVVTSMLLSDRLLVRLTQQVFWRRGIGVVRVLVVGDGMAARDIMAQLLRQRHHGRQLWGCLTVEPQRTDNALLIDAAQPTVVPIHGSVADLDKVMQAADIRQVIIALPGAETELTQRAVKICVDRHVDFRLVPELYGIAAHQVTIDDTYNRPVLSTHRYSLHNRWRVAKRLFDIVLSVLVLLPFGLIVMLLAAIAIKLDSRGPVFFWQKRVSTNGSIFWVYKFRSMHVNAEVQRVQLQGENEKDGPIFKMRNDPRVTRVGKWLRRTSLDELPQIFNILLGEMSWVGPRPPLIGEVEYYEEWHKRRLAILPGLTGLWQVNGRSLLSFDEMVKLDLYYVENWSFWLDFKIIIKTIPSVVRAKGAF